jgi:Na+-driven multidrug efflux pump
VNDDGDVFTDLSNLRSDAVDKPLAPPKDEFSIPSVRMILRFALPATGIYLCSPLLSLIDTSTVGLLAGTNQQAALNPAVSLTEYSSRLISFLYTGTTSLMAASKSQDGDKVAPASGMIGALQLSLLVGGSLGLVMFVFARPLIGAMIGNDQIAREVFDAATRYVRIRALGMPAAAFIGTAQAACLGLQDVRSPLRIIGVAAIINLVADLMLVGSPRAWIGGATGASWATTLAQYAAAGMFLKWLWMPTETIAKIPAEDSSSKLPLLTPTHMIKRLITPATHSKSMQQQSTRGFLAHRSFRDLMRLPTKGTLQDYSPFVVPVTMTQIGRCAVYVAMGYTVSSSFGTTSMAAQQIICSVFYTLIPIADSLSLTAQAFLPSIFNQRPSRQRSIAMRQTTKNLAKAAAFFGIVLSSMMASLPLGVHLFTNDAAVMSMVNAIVPILVAVFTLHGVFCGSEGILLAQKDLTFLGRMYAVYFVVVPYLMLRVKKAAMLGKAVQLQSVWKVFLGYQTFRISAWVLRVLWLQLKCEKDGVANKRQNEGQPRPGLEIQST